MTVTPHPLWPLFDLRIRTDRVVLRLPTDDDLVALAALAKAGIHEPDEMPFAVPWSVLPSPEFELGFVRHHWEMRASWRPDEWVLNLMTEVDGQPAGSQTLAASRFAVLRTVRTGSWLGRAFQGQGLGREMRSAVLGFAFDRLGAEVAETEAMVSNPQSNGVSRSLGYVENGTGRLAPRDVPVDTIRWRMNREVWAERPRPVVTVEGFDRCRDLFG